MISRREFVVGSAAIALASAASGVVRRSESPLVNDIHSQLNPTRLLKIVDPRSLQDVQEIVHTARKNRQQISIAGGRHAMGGQQFGTDTLLIDVRKMSRVLHLDRDRGILEVEAGIEWPELIKGYLALQNDATQSWGIAQKQTGADRLTISGTIAANAHGRGLKMKPFICDVESFVLVDASGNIRTCSDFQFSIERDSEDFLNKGVFSCYRPVPMATPMPIEPKELSDENWRKLLYLAHTDQKQAFERYADYYLSTNGQIYWSDTHQLSIYPENYHREIDAKLHAPYPATETITEINVPRSMLSDFFDEVRADFRKNKVDLIYGTVRLIERDDESFLAWAQQPYACTIFNLHTVHSPEGLQRSADAFRRLIVMAAKRGGTYYLTYHRYASREQVESCYPQFSEFLKLKRKYEPDERFQSDWYRHYRTMFQSG